jgi:hypothetical protein
MKKNYTIAGWLILLALSTLNLQPSTALAQSTWYVWQNSPANGPGTAWNNAFHDIQSAVNVAATGDTVLVTNGVYNCNTNGGSGYVVSVANAITLRSVGGPALTTIQGGYNYGTPYYQYGCVSLGANAVLSGFTLAQGFLALATAGVACGSGAVVTNCTITGCLGDWQGAGASGGTLYNCTLAGNFAGWGGGGANSCVLSNCVLNGNSAYGGGGGANNCTLYNCILTGNMCGGSEGGSGGAGGGAYGCTLINCTLSGNFCQGGESYGGGAYNSVLNGCTLSGNGTGPWGVVSDGGGACWSTLNNCLIASNSAYYGGGAYASTLINCTVVSNSAAVSGGGVVGNEFLPDFGQSIAILTNCIVYDNSAPIYPDYCDTNSVLSYCCATPLASGTGNIASDPQFVDPEAGNYRLLATSPCINAGLNMDWMTNATDLDGYPRIFGGTVDMGAYEYQGYPLIPPTITNSIASTTVGSGGSVSLTVGVSGTPPFTYQWCCNGAPIAGATNATLTISNFCPANAGAYTVTVSNPLGSVTSPPATLASVDLKLFAGVIVNGPVGSNYLIQATSNLSSGWTTLTNVVLPAQPYIFIDYNSPWNPQQFYRAVPQ